jgi:hypothetical protein
MIETTLPDHANAATAFMTANDNDRISIKARI